MKRWQLYFKTDHLPPHLRRISEPFGALARAIVEAECSILPTLEPLYSSCYKALSGAADPEQVAACEEFLSHVRDADESLDVVNLALQSLLAAKDCAVRAHIPDPVTP